jgi:hypothetical protein
MKFFAIISVLLSILSCSTFAKEETFKNTIYPLIKESEPYKALFKNFTFETKVSENIAKGIHTIQVLAVQADQPYKDGQWGEVFSQYIIVFTISSEPNGKSSISKVELTGIPVIPMPRPRPYELVSINEKGELKVHEFTNKPTGVILEILENQK